MYIPKYIHIANSFLPLDLSGVAQQIKALAFFVIVSHNMAHCLSEFEYDSARINYS